MSNPCSSGVGAPNPGAGAVQFLTNIAVAAFLTRIGFGWLGTIAGALPQFSFNVSDFCENGQPDLPVITTDDVLALSNPLLVEEFGPASLKVRDIVLHYLWYDLCHCATVSTPNPPAIQDPPDVVGYGNTGTDACLTGDSEAIAYQYVSGNGSSPFGLWWSSTSSDFGHYTHSTTINPRTVRLVLHRTRSATGEHEDPFKLAISFSNTLNTNIEPAQYHLAVAGDDFDQTFSVPTGAHSVQANFQPGTIETQPDHENANDIFTATWYAYCDSLPGPPTLECCPPDPNIAAALAALRADLVVAKQQIDLIQRQAAPFGFITGISHGGLTGNGHINVADLIGVKIAVQVVPSYIGFDVGDTYELFTDSWINWGNNIWMSPRELIRGYNQLSVPRNAGLFTWISYTLQPGLQIALVELTREP